LVHRPFQLNPGLPQDPDGAVPADEHYARKFGPGFRQVQQRVVQAAAAEGIDMRPERMLVANTLRAHRLLWLAEREGGAEAQDRLSEALFRAYFTEGRNVADPETLVAAAGEAGLDPARVRAFLTGDDGAAEVAEQIRLAGDLGVTAVPTFVIDGRWAVVGAQEPDTLLQVFEQVSAGAAG
jgi:predicted DsbA family dithiol-disulfide isomerase